MNIDIDIVTPFSIGIARVHLDIDNEPIKKWCLQSMENDEGVQQTNLGGWQSHTTMGMPLDVPPEVQELAKIIHQIGNDIGNELYDTNNELSLAESWININRKNNSNMMHKHPGRDLVAVYYVKVPENGGSIALWHPAKDILQSYRSWILPEKETPYNRVHSEFDVKAGDLLLFPGWMTHGVPPNMSDEDRISIAFNFSRPGM